MFTLLSLTEGWKAHFISQDFDQDSKNAFYLESESKREREDAVNSIPAVSNDTSPQLPFGG